MAKIEKIAQAGTLESSDIMITVAPEKKGVHIELQSIVLQQYGEAIRATLEKTIAAQGIDGIRVKASDRGALDCTIRARMLTALSRAGAEIKEVQA
jgi:citrate lyase subunit gamma (acyl carrier protein)